MVRSIVKFGIALIALSAMTMTTHAQVTFGRGRVDTGPKPKNVRGVVRDLRGTPIEGARIFVRNTKTNTTRTSLTNTEGLYALTGLAHDADHEVTVEYKGQTSEKKYVSSFLNREDHVLNFELDIAVVAGGTRSAAEIANDAGPELETFDLVKLRASFEVPSGLPAPIPAVLLLHGYGEDRFAWDALKRQLVARGWAVMTLDLRGHGSSRTKNQRPIMATEEWRVSSHEFPQDLDPALDWIKAQPRIDTGRIAVIGSDIGASLALIASGRYPEVRTVVAVQPNLTESLAMAGSAQDFTPRSALMIVANEAEGEAIKRYVREPAQVRVASTGATTQWIQNREIVDDVFHWLSTTF